jgi:hypothetical protein
MNVSHLGFKVKEFALKFPKEPNYQLTTCSTCIVGKKSGTLDPNRGPRARVLLTQLPSEFLSFLVSVTSVSIHWQECYSPNSHQNSFPF